MTAEQLEASRAERMRQNGHGALTFEDARTWIEETGLCLFLPRRQFSSSVVPSFVEAVAGRSNPTPDPAQIQLAEELLVRLEREDVAVRLNLLGQPGEQPDFVVATWVLPYVYALRGDRDWRRVPQLTGSRQVSQLAIHAYKLLETGEQNISQLKHALGRDVTEAGVIRAITELWQQLRIIPVISAPGVPAKWQLLRNRFQKAIAEGASTSQVTAISVLASIYLQAVIAASMEEVEIFLAPLTARSKVREVLRGLVATRQVHTISLGHAPHFYVAGTLPEFAALPGIYASATISASTYFLGIEDEAPAIAPARSLVQPVHSSLHAHLPVHPPAQNHAPAPTPTPALAQTPRQTPPPVVPQAQPPQEVAATRPAATHRHTVPVKPTHTKPASAQRHFSRPATPARDRKPSQASSSASRTARRPASEGHGSARPASRSTNGHATNGSRPAASRWKSANGSKTAHNGNGKPAFGKVARTNGNGSHPVKGKADVRPSKNAWASKSNGASKTGKPAAKSGSKVSTNGHGKGLARPASNGRKDLRTDARPSRNGASRKPALTAGSKAGNSKRYGFTARPTKRDNKKRG